ncbi:MAG: hypothetical protein KF708_08810 [Pirellulales bacterium]|nr:hypothetical protein [Pirellulales bacterium]
MSRQLMRITPSIVAAAREYQSLKRDGKLPPLHLAECFPIPPEDVLEIWEQARFDLLRRNGSAGFELANVILFKNGSFVAEHVSSEQATDKPSLFDGL